MGRKLDAVLRRGFKTSKFKTLAKLAISRIAVLKNQRQLRFSQARTDVVQLLNLGHQDRALSRVELVIKEQNMLAVFSMIEHYCHLLMERVFIIQNNRECPDELQEAISSLIFAASRCGEFPELQRINKIFTSRFGKEFAARAVELRNRCGVSPKIIQKISTRQPSLESRLKMLKEIASECNITLKLEEDEKLDVNQKQKEPKPSGQDSNHDLNYKPDSRHVNTQNLLIGWGTRRNDKEDDDETLSESMRARRKYGDVATAAQEAFESATCAAAAARAVVVLSRDNHDSHNQQLIKYGSAHYNHSSFSSKPEDEEELKTNKGITKTEMERTVSESVSAASSESEETSISNQSEPCRDLILYGTIAEVTCR